MNPVKITGAIGIVTTVCLIVILSPYHFAAAILCLVLIVSTFMLLFGLEIDSQISENSGK